jgi:hypothetical protein
MWKSGKSVNTVPSLARTGLHSVASEDPGTGGSPQTKEKDRTKPATRETNTLEKIPTTKLGSARFVSKNLSGAALLAEEQPAWSLWLWHETACMSMDVCSDCHRLVAVEAMHTRPTWTEGMRKGCCQPACFVGPCYWCGQPTGAGFECGDR